MAQPLKARNLVPVLRKLDLQLGLRRVGAALKNFHYHKGSVPYLQTGDLLQIALLRRRQKIVHHKVRYLVGESVFLYLKSLPRADEMGRVRYPPLLHDAGRHRHADIFQQHHQLVQRLLRIVGAAAVYGGDDRLRRLQRKVDRAALLPAQRRSCSINRDASEDMASVTCAASISELSRMIHPGAGRSGAISRVIS